MATDLAHSSLLPGRGLLPVKFSSWLTYAQGGLDRDKSSANSRIRMGFK